MVAKTTVKLSCKVLYNQLRWLRVVVACLLASNSFAADPIRLAILAEEDATAAADMLTVQLSGQRDLALIERQEVLRVVAEQHLQKRGLSEQPLRLGQLVKADGVLVLQPVTIEKKRTLAVRLIAVDPGVVITSSTYPFPILDPQVWPKNAAERFGRLLPKLAVRKSQAVPVSLLNIRAPTGTDRDKALERDVTLLLASRLTHQPEIFVLERWRMDDLAWEKELASQEKEPFWSGSQLLDGEVTGDGSTVTVKLRLRAASSAPVYFVASARRDSVIQLTEDLTKQIVQYLQKNPTVEPWQSQAEALQYYTEATWAHRAGLMDVARSAADASWALGCRNDALQVLRVRIYCQLGRMHSWLYRKDQTVTRPIIERAIAGMQFFCDFLESHDLASTPRGHDHWIILLNEVLQGPSHILRNLHDNKRQSEFITEAAEMRGLIRRIEKWPYPEPTKWLEQSDPNKRYAKSNLEANMGNYRRLKASYLCFWYTNPEEVLAEYRGLLGYKFCEVQESYFLRNTLCSYVSRESCPWLVDWSDNTSLTFRQRWLEFVESLCRDASVETRLDGLLLKLGSLAADRGQRNRKLTDNEIAVAKTALDELWVHRQDFKDPRIRGMYIALVSEMVGDADVWTSWEHRIDLLRFLLQEKKAFDTYGLTRLWKPEDMSETQAQEFAELLEQYIADPKVRSWPYAEIQYNRLKGALLAENPALLPSQPNTLIVRQYWEPALQPDMPQRRYSMQSVIWRNGQLWMIGMCGRKGQDNGLVVFSITPHQPKAQVIPVPEKLLYSDDGKININLLLEVTNGHVFIFSQYANLKFDRATLTWSKMQVFGSTPRSTCFANGSLYILSGDNIVKVDPTNGHYEVVASSRRRPALHILDDINWQSVGPIYSGVNGKVLVTINNDPYEVNPRGEAARASECYAFNVAEQTDTHTIAGGIWWDFWLIDHRREVIEPLISDKFMCGVRRVHFKPGRWKQPADMNKCRVLPGAGFDGANLWVLCQEKDGNSQSAAIRCFKQGEPDSFISLRPKLQMEESTQKALSSLMPQASFSQTRLEPPEPQRMILTPEGIVLFERAFGRGFWFIPKRDLYAQALGQHKSATHPPTISVR